jgi:starvation-inducible outer membrane lipoprotein
MKTTLRTLVLLFLTGCGEPQTITQPDIPAQQPAAVTTPPVTSEQATAGFAGKVIKVVECKLKHKNNPHQNDAGCPIA